VSDVDAERHKLIYCALLLWRWDLAGWRFPTSDNKCRAGVRTCILRASVCSERKVGRRSPRPFAWECRLTFSCYVPRWVSTVSEPKTKAGQMAKSTR
jgi:hypothetical protein